MIGNSLKNVLAKKCKHLGGLNDKQNQYNNEAVKWYSKAAEQGYAAAQSNLGLMYLDGRGVNPDYVNAQMWFNVTITQGYDKAHLNRVSVERKMKAADISKAQELARDCVNKQFKGCWSQ